jgi:hypothetical protein
MARTDRLFLARTLGRLSWLIALSLVLLVAFSRCGSDKKNDDDDKDGVTTPETPSGEVPASWDGQADWNESPFEVVEE